MPGFLTTIYLTFLGIVLNSLQSFMGALELAHLYVLVTLYYIMKKMLLFSNIDLYFNQDQ